MEIGIKKLFSSFSSGSKWKKYTNSKQYGKNAITHLPKASEITEDFCKQNAHSYRLQYKESLETMKTTSNPTVFFYRYDMAIKKAIGLAYMQEKNIRICLNSDCHDRTKLACNFQESLEMIRSVGYSSMVILTSDGFKDLSLEAFQ